MVRLLAKVATLNLRKHPFTCLVYFSNRGENEMDSDKKEEMDNSEILVDEIRGIRTLMAFVAILLTVMLILMIWVFFHLTRLVLAP